jgi:hypothetical protein
VRSFFAGAIPFGPPYHRPPNGSASEIKIEAAFVISQLLAVTERIHRLLVETQIVVSTGACAFAGENNPRTDSRERTTTVNTPRIVPKGMKRHSMQAITSANE